ncbi:MAG: hypothetical protein ACFB15_17405 [Cyclobacteriaceae bacterium]|mgnify:CR=1 FL=1
MRFRLFVFRAIAPKMLMEDKNLVLANLLVAAILTGLIWTIQLVHYPSFRHVGVAHFVEFQHRHMRNILYLVAPLMLIEIFLAVCLQVSVTEKSTILEVTFASGLLFLIWVVTFAISSPIHGQLATQGFDDALISKLVTTNWIRTIAWTFRTVLLTVIMFKVWN